MNERINEDSVQKESKSSMKSTFTSQGGESNLMCVRIMTIHTRGMGEQSKNPPK